MAAGCHAAGCHAAGCLFNRVVLFADNCLFVRALLQMSTTCQVGALHAKLVHCNSAPHAKLVHCNCAQIPHNNTFNPLLPEFHCKLALVP